MKEFSEAFNPEKFDCYPKIEANHQAWNGTDSYLYNHLVRENLLFEEAKILILNDETGLLTYLLREYKPTVTSDSIFAKLAIEQNFISNDEDTDQYTFVDSVNFAEEEQEHFDIVLMKIPKATKYFTDQLKAVRSCTNKKTLYFSSGMVKHISRQSKELLEKSIGETLVHRVEKKAILFSSTKTAAPTKTKSVSEFSIDGMGSFTSYSNIFSTGKLDKGTALLLKEMPTDLEGTVADLGSGYGVITRFINDNCDDVSQIIAIDSSRMAAESTAMNVEGIRIIWDDGLLSLDDNSLDAVVSNPPFHHDTSFSVNMGLRLFKQVHAKLKPGGRFIMVANSGLNYSPYLKKLFSGFSIISRDRVYTVFELTK